MLPEQFTNRMKELLKEEYEDFAACYRNDHAHSLRINPLKGTKEQYDQTSVFKQREPLKEQVAWEENGFYYEDSLQPGKHPFHEAGVYYIQEASAMGRFETILFKGSKMQSRAQYLKSMQIRCSFRNKIQLISKGKIGSSLLPLPPGGLKCLCFKLFECSDGFRHLV